MIGLEKYHDSLCPLCGYPKEICHAPYGTYVYDTEAPIRCNIKSAQRNARKGREDSDLLIFPSRVRPWGAPADD